MENTSNRRLCVLAELTKPRLQSGILARGSTPLSAFPGSPSGPNESDSPLTVAGPRRFFTGLPWHALIGI